ncbi:unannotated protein [freshwater metagenome]|uniref:Unannotated protein n=1 Tax=freshwater metagenome TaxID=449393 RepID=A0A6J7CV77_9ZZZZ|nr:DUF3027 domain-containing protein [Actinomycetota bacterium]
MTKTQTHKADPALIDGNAIKVAVLAAQGVEGSDRVGAHEGFIAEGDHVVTHYFACLNFAYKGWRWAVTLSHAPGTKGATLDEVVLLPSEDAILPPAWVPWSERIEPGDLGIGDVLPTREDDPRLVPGYTGADLTLPEELTDPLNPPGWEVGLGRERVLSVDGREAAAERWYTSDFGPRSAMAQAAPARCTTCGFLVPIGGAMRQAFGVCANAIAPSDGHVVSLDYGCGAHSQAEVQPISQAPDALIIDEESYELVEVRPSQELPANEDSSPSEELGHS